jgi:DNA recombination protein RmuC
MNDLFLILVCVLLLGVLVVQFIHLRISRRAGGETLVADVLALTQQLERLDRALREEFAVNRTEASGNARSSREDLTRSLDAMRLELAQSGRSGREELTSSFGTFGDALSGRVMEIATLQKSQLEAFSRRLQDLIDSGDLRMDRLREAVEARLIAMQEDNNRKLELMRATVDEKLHATLEQRLGQSFRLVSERLEAVQKGLGEMQSLASGVDGLKRVLTNVKTRGTWGEVQLGAILEEMLTPEQYGRNVATKPGSSDRVEYAVKFPGRSTDGEGGLWLPIDAKFPQEDYQKLVDAQEQANPVLADEAGRQLESRIKLEARSIREKYISPPHTTDFAILFLPTEGLYAEVLRRPGLADGLQREHRVTIAGPATLAALLNSLQMGFRTLAIEKRSSEVWALLGNVKTEFGRFGEILEKTQKKLHEASTTIEDAARKTRTIERRLRAVQELPARDAPALPAVTDDPPAEG